MEANQVYTLVNSAVAQGLGRTDLTAIDSASLVSVGNVVLSSQTNTDAFLNTLVQRIGRTIISYRRYTSKLGDMVLTDFEWGAILQKLKVRMPEATIEEDVALVDGQSVDHYKVAKPSVGQKLFVGRSPFKLFVTIQRVWLKEAFLSDSAMAAFIGAIYGEVQNKIELSFEQLGRAALGYGVSQTAGTAREIKLVTLYNAGVATADQVTAQTALRSPDFLRWAIGELQLYPEYFTDMSTLYNDGTETRHTPREDQRMRILTAFDTALRTQVQYSAYNKEMLELGAYTKLNYWQAAETPMSVLVAGVNSEDVRVDNIVAILHDRDAVGCYKQEEDVLTTPVNAFGSYYNTVYHVRREYMFDTSENFVVFTLN